MAGRKHHVRPGVLVENKLGPIGLLIEKLERKPSAQPTEILITIAALPRHWRRPQIPVSPVLRTAVGPQIIARQCLDDLARTRQFSIAKHLHRRDLHRPMESHTERRKIRIGLDLQCTGLDLAHCLPTTEHTERRSHLPRRARIHVFAALRRHPRPDRQPKHLGGFNHLHRLRVSASTQPVPVLHPPPRTLPRLFLHHRPPPPPTRRSHAAAKASGLSTGAGASSPLGRLCRCSAVRACRQNRYRPTSSLTQLGHPRRPWCSVVSQNVHRIARYGRENSIRILTASPPGVRWGRRAPAGHGRPPHQGRHRGTAASTSARC